VALAEYPSRTVDLSSEADVAAHFQEFIKYYDRQYATAEEHTQRLANFRRNLAHIQAHNTREPPSPYWLRMNHFGDQSRQEYLTRTLARTRTYPTPAHQGEMATGIPAVGKLNPANPDTVHWEKAGGVTPVKDQGQCGSCWAFSVTGAVETAWFNKTGKLVSVSEQQLVDCTKSYGNLGCDGGEMGPTMQYIIDNKWIDTEASYPYKAWEGKTCLADASKAGASIVSYINITSGCDTCLEDAAVNGSVSVAIDASSDDFQFYGGGIYEEVGCSKTQLDHGVLVVGYDTLTYSPKDIVPYWWVKNSWSRDWGDAGYIKMRKAITPVDPWKNMCGICTDATQPFA